MADDDDDVPESTMQVDAEADAGDVLSDDSPSVSPGPPALPPPLPPKKRGFPVLIALVVAVGAGLLVGEVIAPDAPEAAAADAESQPSSDEAAPEAAPPQIDLGPILVEASHDAGADAHDTQD
ncbi:MAG: hypothetical protein GXP55_15225 [Deltaproteobacteria bacterium]|nr:hypothetical protein [Deltaproteobacteria bacterium]